MNQTTNTNTTASIDLAQLDSDVIERAIRFLDSGMHTIIARDTMANELRKLLARRSLTSGAPAGYKLVPIKPTPKMVDATFNHTEEMGGPESHNARNERIYAAMVAAAPVHDAAAPSNEQALADMEARKDAAYYERNQVVAALAKCFPSGVARTAIEGWSEDWHGCVYIDLPTGQVSWHFHDSQAHLFAGLPPYAGKWDGHDTPEKYHRVGALEVSAGAAAKTEQGPGQWVRCTPDLIKAGVSCANTPRRDGDGTYSHDHFIAHGSPTAAGAGSEQVAMELDRADCSPVPVSNQELAAFHRFCDCCEDSDAGGHDVPKAMMSQLVRIGLIRPAGPGRHETTKFGDWMRDVAGERPSAPSVPVQDERALPGCLADRLHEAIDIARDRAVHAGSTTRRKKWEATAADLRAALAHPVQDGEKDAKGDKRADQA